MATLKDPVEAKAKERAEKSVEESVGVASLSGLNIGDLKAVPIQTATAVHPFDGYPMPLIKIGEHMKGTKMVDTMIKSTFLVVLSPNFNVPQDPSGYNVSIVDTKTRKERRVNLKSFHSAFVRDFDEGGEANCDVVFDREITLEDGTKVMVAVVPHHSVRAQLFFYKDQKSGRTKVSKDYLLIDGDQISRLRKTFDWIYSNKINAAEKASRDFDEAPESRPGDN